MAKGRLLAGLVLEALEAWIMTVKSGEGELHEGKLYGFEDKGSMVRWS